MEVETLMFLLELRDFFLRDCLTLHDWNWRRNREVVVYLAFAGQYLLRLQCHVFGKHVCISTVQRIVVWEEVLKELVVFILKDLNLISSMTCWCYPQCILINAEDLSEKPQIFAGVEHLNLHAVEVDFLQNLFAVGVKEFQFVSSQDSQTTFRLAVSACYCC